MSKFKVFGAGLFTGSLLFLLITWDWPMDAQVGKTYSELKEMKKQCEASLPRNKNCKAEVRFVEEKSK